MDREEFIETQVAFQIGRCVAEPGLDLEEWARATAARRGSLLYHDPVHRSFIPEERGEEVRLKGKRKWIDTLSDTDARPGQKHRALRNATVLSELYAARLAVPILVDMQDAIRMTDAAFPVFQYNRQAGSANAVLWPHRRVHAIGSKAFCALPDPAEPRLSQKAPTLVWRGSLRGFSTLEEKPSNIKYVIKMFIAGKYNKETLLAHLGTIPRWALVSRYFGVEGFDVGFPGESLGEYAQVPEIARYAVDYASPAEQLKHKYLISIQGTDVGTSFGWQLGSNSVLLKQTYPWEVFFDCHIRPWEHFVPVSPDFSDLAQKLVWCEDNPEACAAMVDKRHEAVHLLLDRDVRRVALRRVAERYGDFYREWRRASANPF